jgi:ABC-type Mn2+/Zn2+ transport system permease subunit
MGTLLEILSPAFTLRNSLYASVLAGAFVPLVGVHLVIGRRAILALALPQVSTLGVALTVWTASVCGMDIASENHGGVFLAMALGGALAAMAFAMLWQHWVVKHMACPEDAESGGLYAVAAAVTLAIAASRRVPELGLLDVLRGEILAVQNSLLECEAVGFASIAIILFMLRKPLHFALYDHAQCFASGLPADALTVLATAIVSLTIALGGLCAGPLTIFALLVLPSLTFLPLARNLKQLYWASALTGVACSFAGFWLSYSLDEWNLPIPAAQVSLLGIVWVLARVIPMVRPARRKTVEGEA